MCDLLQVLSVAFVSRLVGAFVLGMIPYLYIPFASFLNIARWTWGDQRSISGFVNHVLRTEYGTFNLVRLLLMTILLVWVDV